MRIYPEASTATEMALERIADSLEKLVDLKSQPELNSKMLAFLDTLPQLIAFKTEEIGGDQE
jgi:hypothetical protein